MWGSLRFTPIINLSQYQTDVDHQHHHSPDLCCLPPPQHPCQLGELVTSKVIIFSANDGI